jgi:hypothetical protein
MLSPIDSDLLQQRRLCGAVQVPDFDTNRYILIGVLGRRSLNCKALWISYLDTWPKILDTYMGKIDLKCPQILLYFYVREDD